MALAQKEYIQGSYYFKPTKSYFMTILAKKIMTFL